MNLWHVACASFVSCGLIQIEKIISRYIYGYDFALPIDTIFSIKIQTNFGRYQAIWRIILLTKSDSTNSSWALGDSNEQKEKLNTLSVATLPYQIIVHIWIIVWYHNRMKLTERFCFVLGIFDNPWTLTGTKMLIIHVHFDIQFLKKEKKSSIKLIISHTLEVFESIEN